MDAQRELLELAKEMLGYSDLTPEQIEWAARIEALATTMAAREDGWVLVPREPTEEMIDAVAEYFGWCDEDRQHPHERGEVVQTYQAMLAALPAAPPAQGTGEG